MIWEVKREDSHFIIFAINFHLAMPSTFKVEDNLNLNLRLRSKLIIILIDFPMNRANWVACLIPIFQSYVNNLLKGFCVRLCCLNLNVNVTLRL